MEREITVNVDGNETPLNPFVRSMMINVITGMIRTLKGVNPEGRIEITLEAEEMERR
jgi:hypothetical protein